NVNQDAGVHENIFIGTWDLASEVDHDVVQIDKTTSGGYLTVSTGSGNDTIHLADTQGQWVQIHAGDGNDTAEMYRSRAVESLFADLGNGDDSLLIDTLSFSGFSASDVRLDGGAGTDTLNLKNLDPTLANNSVKTNWEWINGRLQPAPVGGTKGLSHS